ncbi:MAG TPA: hypothetical protein VF053_16020 [Streptosporangiales bacterium]
MTRDAEMGFWKRPWAVGAAVASGTGLVMSMVGLTVEQRPLQTLTVMATNVVGWGLIAHASRRAGRREGLSIGGDRGPRTDAALRQGRDRRLNEQRRRFTDFRAR